MCTAAVHNTRRAYEKHGCRCPEMVERMRKRWRDSRRQRTERAGHPLLTPYVDQIAVERACTGRGKVRLTVHERREAVRRLHALGLSGRQIGERLGVCERTVRRYIHRLGTQPVDKVDASRSLPDDVDGGEVAA